MTGKVPKRLWPLLWMITYGADREYLAKIAKDPSDVDEALDLWRRRRYRGTGSTYE